MYYSFHNNNSVCFEETKNRGQGVVWFSLIKHKKYISFLIQLIWTFFFRYILNFYLKINFKYFCLKITNSSKLIPFEVNQTSQCYVNLTHAYFTKVFLKYSSHFLWFFFDISYVITIKSTLKPNSKSGINSILVWKFENKSFL